MSNRDLKAKPAEGQISTGKVGWEAIGARQSDIITNPSPRQAIQKRRPDAKAGALVKLDVCEHRLHVANTTGDGDTWSRYYLAWCRLHRVAFNYGGER